MNSNIYNKIKFVIDPIKYIIKKNLSNLNDNNVLWNKIIEIGKTIKRGLRYLKTFNVSIKYSSTIRDIINSPNESDKSD